MFIKNKNDRVLIGQLNMLKACSRSKTKKTKAYVINKKLFNNAWVRRLGEPESNRFSWFNITKPV